MDYVNYYITLLTIALNSNLSPAITNTGPNDGSSIPKDFKRHIGLAPDTNWEPGLREAAHQTLLKERVTLNHLREKILQAPMSGQGAKVSPFGDVAILARGQLFANSNGFRFVQDPHPNDCIDCHELRQCYGKECEIYLHNGLGERLIALWTVKRLRHRNPDVRYELEYSISPIRKHVWVTKNGGYDYSIPGHVFVVKTGHVPGLSQNGYFTGTNQKGQHDKYAELPHYPHPAVPTKIHSNKHPFVSSKPAPNTGEWVQINQPPPLLPLPPPDKLPNYYLPQKKPGDQTAMTSQKDVQPTLDYAEIEAYKNLLQVLHQKTSTTEHKFKPSKVTPPTHKTTPMKTTPQSAATLPTRPPLSHTTWLLPSTTTKVTRPTTKVTRPSAVSSTSTLTHTTERPRTTKTMENTKTSTFTRPPLLPTSYDTTRPTYSTTQSRPGTTSSFRPTIIQEQSTIPAQQSTKPQTIYQQLGGFESTKAQTIPTTLSMASFTTRTKPASTQPVTYPMKTTIPMTHLPTQPSYTSGSSFSQETTKQKETTQAMTTWTTRGNLKPTKPMTSQSSRPTKPVTTTGWTRPADGQTTSTFLFSTKVTPPFGLGNTKPVGFPVTPIQNTISTFYGKPGLNTIYHPDTGNTQYYDKTTLPMRYPTSSTFPGSTQPGSTYQSSYYGETTIPVRSTLPSVTGTDQSFTGPVRGTEPGSTFGITSGTKYPTTQYLPSTTSMFSKPTTIYTEGTRGTTIYDHKTTSQGTTNYYPGSTAQQGDRESTRPTGLLETTKVTFPTTNGYQRPIPTFFIDPTHPGYPKTTPTTPFTDGQAFKPSQPDPVYHPLPPWTKPSTIFTPPTKPTTITDFTNMITNGDTEEPGKGTTLLLPSSTDRYTPPPSTHAHKITLPTKLPKPSTPFKVPAIDDYDVHLFPRDPNAIKTTTSTIAPPTIPTGDFILPDEKYKPHQLIPELNQEEVDVFDKLSPVTSTTEKPTATFNPSEIKEVFDSATLKPKPPIDESIFDELFKQDTPTTTLSPPNGIAAKVIYSDFFEASTALPTRVLEAFTTIPSTSQSFSTSVSIEVNNKNKADRGNGNTKGKIVKKLKFRKVKVKEVPQPDGDYRVYKAEHPEQPQQQQQQTQDLIENIEITNNGNHPEPSPSRPKYGPNGRKYKNKLKATSTVSTGVTKAFDDLALQLVNHARTIDYLEAKPTDVVSEKSKPKTRRVGNEKANVSSNTNLQNRNKYKRKSYGRVRKVKKRTENKATITRANRGAIKAHNSTNISKTIEDETETVEPVETIGKIVKNVEHVISKN